LPHREGIGAVGLRSAEPGVYISFADGAVGHPAPFDSFPDGSIVLPAGYTLTITPDDPTLPLCELDVAAEQGRLRCVEVRCRARPDGPAITSDLLRRVPVARYLRETTDFAARRVVVRRSGSRVLRLLYDPETPDDRAALKAVAATYPAAAQTRRRARKTDDDWRQVARVYRNALSLGQHPTRAVQEHFHIARPTAARWVMRARERGFLGRAERGKAGELS
jgi:hypothetical protein